MSGILNEDHCGSCGGDDGNSGRGVEDCNESQCITTSCIQFRSVHNGFHEICDDQ